MDVFLWYIYIYTKDQPGLQNQCLLVLSHVYLPRACVSWINRRPSAQTCQGSWSHLRQAGGCRCGVLVSGGGVAKRYFSKWLLSTWLEQFAHWADVKPWQGVGWLSSTGVLTRQKDGKLVSFLFWSTGSDWKDQDLVRLHLGCYAVHEMVGIMTDPECRQTSP